MLVHIFADSQTCIALLPGLTDITFYVISRRQIYIQINFVQTQSNSHMQISSSSDAFIRAMPLISNAKFHLDISDTLKRRYIFNAKIVS